jgi:phosphoribosylaminoimidazolecarboxamide formyltransferase / IMP cyclohydrolase
MRWKVETCLQEHDSLSSEDITFEVVSVARPTDEMMKDLRFAWRCVKHVKSNAITVAKGEKLLGMGAGQPNRVKSTQLALEKVGLLPVASP